ncbi:MAG: 30S ribosome-binding factor RbfA [Clostridium sp.]|nr:30S ribosome-binding factor RbfA [Clostridium sp.]
MRKNSVKNIRVSSEVTKELSSIIRDLKDPRVSPMASVVSAQVTPDLKFCKVHVSVFGSEEELKDTILGLKNASGFIRNQLAKNINLRNTPELLFVADTSIEYGVRMTKMIDDVAEYDREHAVPDPEEEE